MPSPQDRQIFVTGVVGRAMGSGKFSKEDILFLTQAAYDAFCTIFGVVEEAPAKLAPQPAPRSVGRAESVASISSAILGESAPFTAWSGEKARYGSGKWDPVNGKLQPDITWGEWMEWGKDGQEVALRALHTMAQRDLQAGTKWEKSNRIQSSRAQAVLKLIKGE